MRLQTRMALSTGGLIVTMLISGFTAQVRIQQAERLSADNMARVPLIRMIEDAGAHMNMSVRAAGCYLLLGKGAQNSRFREERALQMRLAEETLTQAEMENGKFAGFTDAQTLRQLSEGFSHLKSLEEQAELLAASGNPNAAEQAAALFEHGILPAYQENAQAISHATDAQLDQRQQQVQRMTQSNGVSMMIVWLGAIGSALAAGLASFMVVRHILTMIRVVADRANSIAEGDLMGEELNMGTDDQIGKLAEAMNRMQKSLGGIIGTVADTAGALTGSAASMRSASDQIHRRIDQQSQQTQQAATSMQEMSSSIAEVSRHTHSAAETARAAAQTARDGGAIVKEMLGSMHSIALAVTETSATVGLLGEDSRRISQIVTVIDEIARKTNLLALNAAIEAARAGEQGRGFAVVAGEVRRLAESTAQATGEIGNMIQEIQDRTRKAIASMSAGTGTVEQGVVTTTQAGEALERIIGMAERVDRMITQIAIAASQQATAADRSSESLDSIHSLSHENLTEMATTAAGIESLRGTAVRLEKQVDRFHLQGHNGYGQTQPA